MKYLIGNCLKLFSFLVHIQPRKLQLFWGDVLAFLAFDVFQFRRKVTIANVRLAYPDKQESERIRIARGSYRNLGRALIEYSHLPFMTSEWVDKNFEFRGWEHINRALAQKQGVMLLTLHLGNGDLGMSALAKKGYPVNLISKHFRTQWLNDLWFGLRQKTGMRFIPEKKSSYQILRALKNNDAIVFVLDQFMGPPAGVSTIFFGKETGTAQGLAIFALRSHAPVIPAYTYREADGKCVVVFEAEIPVQQTEDHEADVSKMTQIYTSQLEKFVKKYPEQWMWLHRRWKTFEVR